MRLDSPEPTLRLAVDASCCAKTEMAGIAVVEVKPNPRLVAAEVLPAASSTYAEGLAAMRATSYATSAAFEHVSGTIWTDSLQLVRAVNQSNGRRPRPAYIEELVAELRVALERRELILEDRPRSDVRDAHRAARAVLKAWKAGQSGDPTWNRPHYLKP